MLGNRGRFRGGVLATMGRVMIVYNLDTMNPRVHRFTWFWSPRQGSKCWRLQRSPWRGALSVYWVWPRVVWRDMSDSATAWTGRHRSPAWISGMLAVYLRTPCTQRWKWEIGRV